MLKSVFQNFTSSFSADEDGAVTVDWVVLTASVVLFGVIVVGGFSGALSDAGTGLADTISDVLT